MNHEIYLKLRQTLLLLQAEQMNFCHSKWPGVKNIIILSVLSDQLLTAVIFVSINHVIQQQAEADYLAQM
jgi:hypothetical protein